MSAGRAGTGVAARMGVEARERLGVRLGPIVAAFLVSRLLVLVAALLAELVVSRNPALTSGASGPILSSLTSWDGWFYLGIARDGYHAAPVIGTYHDYAFLPLYPLLVRVLSLGQELLVGPVALLVSNAAFLVSLGFLARLGEIHLGRERAERAVLLLAISPFAAVFSMAYAESLFLMLALGAFLAAERDRRALAGLLVLAAGLARLQGVAIVPLIWLVLYLRDRRRVRPSQAWALLGLVGTLAFLGYTAWLSGSAGGYAATQSDWGRSGVGSFAAGESLLERLTAGNLVQLGVLLVSVFLLVYIRPDRIPLPYALMPILFIGSTVASGILESIGRYATLAFPYSWILASRRAQVFRVGWPILSGGLLLVFATASFAGWFVP